MLIDLYNKAKKKLSDVETSVKNYVKDDRTTGGILRNTLSPNNVSQAILTAPKYTFADNVSWKNPIKKLGAETLQGTANTFLGVRDFSNEAADQYYGNKPADTKKLAGMGAKSALDLFTLGYGGGAAENLYKQGLKTVATGQIPKLSTQIVKNAARMGRPSALIGAGYGGADSLEKGDSVKNIIFNTAKGGAMGYGLGSVLGGGSTAVGALGKAVRNDLAGNVSKKLRFNDTPQPGTVSSQSITGRYGQGVNVKVPGFIDTVKSPFQTPQVARQINEALPRPGFTVEDVTKNVPEMNITQYTKSVGADDNFVDLLAANDPNRMRFGNNVLNRTNDRILSKQDAYYRAREDYRRLVKEGKIIDPSGEFKRENLVSEENARLDEKTKSEINKIENQIKTIENLGSMSHGKNGKLKPSYQRTVDVYRSQIEKLVGEQSQTKQVLNSITESLPTPGMSIKKVGQVRNNSIEKIPEDLAMNSEAGYQVMTELELSKAGERHFVGYGSDQQIIPESSSFPQWVPSELRSRSLFDSVSKHIVNGTVPKSSRQAALYNVVREQILERGKRFGSTQSDTVGTQNLDEINKELLYSKPESIQPTPRQMGIFKQGIVNAKKNVVPEMTQQEAQNSSLEAQYMAEANKPGFQDTFAKWVADRNIAQTKGYQIGSKIEIPKGEEWNVIKAIEGTGETTAKGTVNQIRGEFNKAFQEAKDFGLDLNYLKQYITHIWEQSPQEVAQAYKTAGQKFKFGKERSLPTYEEGIQLGLTPKYNNPRQILAHYIQKLEETKANVNFLKDLKMKGLIVDASVAQRTPGLVPINAQGFGQSRSRVSGDATIIGQYFADPQVAQKVNQVFGGVPEGTLGKGLDYGAKASSTLQDLTLSGGVPKTPLNAFTIAQMTKEILGGRLQSPLGSFFRSMSGEATKNFYEKNIGQIQKMQERNVPITTTLDIDSLGESGFLQKALLGSNPAKWEQVKSVWSKAMNEPTFKRFMGQLQVNLFNDIEEKALKSGKTAQEAVDIAAGAVKNFYGLTSTAKVAQRDPAISNLATTTLFAPRYREAMINFWVNNLKALGHPLKLENRANIAFNVGSLALFAGYDYMNYQLNGHHLWDNPKGKEDKLLIPGEETTVGVPFLSSIATIPRGIYRQGKMLAEGDVSGAAKDAFQTYSSSLIKPVADVVANSDYFGNEIYNENETTGDKFGKIGSYLAAGYTGHPYIKAAQSALSGDKSGGQIASQALELPFRFYKTESIKNAPFWEEYANQKKVDEVKKQMKYGDLSEEAGLKRIEELTKDNKTELGQKIKMKNGGVAFKTSKGIQFADSEEEADKALSKDSLKNTDENVTKIGGKYLVKYPSGRIYEMDEAQYQKYQEKQSGTKTQTKKPGRRSSGGRKAAKQEEYKPLTGIDSPSALIKSLESKFSSKTSRPIKLPTFARGGSQISKRTRKRSRMITV